MNMTSPQLDRSLMIAAELVDEPRHALVKQAGSIVTMLDTGYGYLPLTADESANAQSLARPLLEIRLAKLEGGPRHV